MQAFQPSYTHNNYTREARKSVIHKFLAWFKAQEENRILWLASMVIIHGCVLTPVTIFFILFAGTSMLFMAFAIAAMTMTLVVNLAAMPTKITIPAFFLSIVIDLAVIAVCISSGLSFPAS